MELLLSAISAGGLVGASNQYLCLLLVSIAAKVGLITLAGPMEFMKEWWFIGLVALFWVLTVAPSYATLLGPGIMNALNTISNFLSGFVVPLSGAIFSLAAAGIIIDLNPTLRNLLMTIQLFKSDGSLGFHGYIVAGGGALLASALSGMRFLAKPGLSASSGVIGSYSAPIYASLENASSVILLALLFLLARINPWLLVALFVIVALLILCILAFAIYQLWRLSLGLGKLLRLFGAHPGAGLAVIAEALVWGSGWIIFGKRRRGLPRLILWVLWLALILLLSAGSFTGIGVVVGIIVLILGIYGSLKSANALLRDFEKTGMIPTPAKA